MTILVSIRTPQPIVASSSNYMEGPTTGMPRSPPKAQMDVHADHTVRFVKDKAIPPQSVRPIRVITGMRGLVAVEPMHDFGERRCCIPMRWLIDLTQRSPLKIVVTHFTNKLVLLQKSLRLAAQASPPARVVNPGYPSIIAQ